MTDCAAVRELMEIATVERGGLDRLMAGDVPEAAMAAGHLAACPPCAEELARLHRADAILRPILASMPSPELRDRVLAQVHTVGRVRGGARDGASVVAGSAGGGSADGPEAGEDDPASVGSGDATSGQVRIDRGASRTGPLTQVGVAGRAPAGPRLRRRLWWPAAAAAALVVGLLGGGMIGQQWAPAPTDESAIALAAVSRETANLLAAPDAETIVLRDVSGTPRGSLVAARSRGRMVVIATGLPDPGPGRVYRCWVEVNGSRTALGEMWPAREVLWWSGPADLPSAPRGSLTFGVSLATVEAPAGSGGAAQTPVPVLTGS